MNMNHVVLIGNLGNAPEIKYFESGKAKASFTLYVNGYKKDDVSRFKVECWEKTAEFAANHLATGSRVAISGRLQEQTWLENGNKRCRIVVIAERIESLTPKPATADTPTEEATFEEATVEEQELEEIGF